MNRSEIAIGFPSFPLASKPGLRLNRQTRPESRPDAKWFLKNRGSYRPTFASQTWSSRTPTKVTKVRKGYAFSHAQNALGASKCLLIATSAIASEYLAICPTSQTIDRNPTARLTSLTLRMMSAVSDLSSASQLATLSIQSFDFFRSPFINALNESSINNRTLSL